MEKIKLSEKVTNEVVQRTEGQFNQYPVKKKKTNWLGHILRKNFFYKMSLRNRRRKLKEKEEEKHISLTI